MPNICRYQQATTKAKLKIASQQNQGQNQVQNQVGNHWNQFGFKPLGTKLKALKLVKHQSQNSDPLQPTANGLSFLSVQVIQTSQSRAAGPDTRQQRCTAHLRPFLSKVWSGKVMILVNFTGLNRNWTGEPTFECWRSTSRTLVLRLGNPTWTVPCTQQDTHSS